MNFEAISFPFSLTSAVAKVFDLLGSIIQKALAKPRTTEIDRPNSRLTKK